MRKGTDSSEVKVRHVEHDDGGYATGGECGSCVIALSVCEPLVADADEANFDCNILRISSDQLNSSWFQKVWVASTAS